MRECSHFYNRPIQIVMQSVSTWNGFDQCFAGVRVQDSDIKTDIDRSILDELLKEQQLDQADEDEDEER